MAVNIKDVARQSGVSVATVSRALRNTPGVAPQTRQRVTQSAVALGYVMARTSAGRSTRQGYRARVLLPAVNTWFFSTVLAQLGKTLMARDTTMDIQVLDAPAQRIPFFATQAGRCQADAFIVVGMTLTRYERSVLHRLPVPVAGLHTLPAPGMQVGLDDVALGCAAAEHLTQLGHRRMAVIASRPGSPVPHFVSQRRSSGFWQRVVQEGLQEIPGAEVCGLDTSAGGAAAMVDLLRLNPAPTGVFVHSDDMALGALAAARAGGVRVPEDLSIVSVDNNPAAVPFGLTTFDQHVEEQARATAELVLAALAERNAWSSESDQASVSREPELLLRSSTAPVPDAHLAQAC